MTTPICRAITLWQPWASLCVIPRPCVCWAGDQSHLNAGPLNHCRICDDSGERHPFKTIETRSWKAPDSLIGQRIAIHAAARPVEDLGKVGPFTTWRWNGDSGMTDTTTPNAQEIVLPLGAIVGTAVLADCVPMVQFHSRGPGHQPEPLSSPFPPPQPPILAINNDGSALSLHRGHGSGIVDDVSDQRPFGHFAPCRWAWLLDKPIKFAEPIPCRGYQRVWTVPEELRYIFARGALR